MTCSHALSWSLDIAGVCHPATYQVASVCVRRKATGSLKIVHEKYGEKMKGNQDETEAYYNEFRTAKAVNEAMEGHIQKVCHHSFHHTQSTICRQRLHCTGSTLGDSTRCSRSP